MQIHGTYDSALVALSYLVAVVASFGALTLAERIFQARGTPRLAWLAGRERLRSETYLWGSLAMGAAIAGMHCVGMEAAVFSTDTPVADGATLFGPPPDLVLHSAYTISVGQYVKRPERSSVAGPLMVKLASHVSTAGPMQCRKQLTRIKGLREEVSIIQRHLVAVHLSPREAR